MRFNIYPVLLAVMILAPACGGGGSTGDQMLFKREKYEFNQEQPVLEYGIEHAQPAPESTVFLDGVPGLDELAEMPRGTSDLEPTLRFGSEIADAGFKSNCNEDGTNLVMSPDWVREAVPPTSDLAWAIYGFNLPGYSEPGTLQLWWNSVIQPVGNLYIGVSDYSTGRWKWFLGPAGNSAIDFGPLASYFSDTDDIYFTVLLTGQGDYSLAQMRLGDNLLPGASFIPDVSSGEVPLTVNFDGSASSDVDGDIVSWEWDLLGDGSFGAPSATSQASHEYTQTGNYLVRLRVTDNEGGTGITENVISVTPVDNNEAPTAVLGADKTTGSAPLQVNLNGTGSSDPDGSIVRYEWDLDGNGSYETDTGAVDNVPTVINDPGSYDVKLRVTDNQGSTGTDNLLIEVSEVGAGSPPVADLNVDYWFKTADGLFSFDGSQSTDPDNDIVKYEFDWDNDGNFDLDNGASPLASHSFTQGSHDVALRVTDSGDRTSTETISIVYGNPLDYHETEANDTFDTSDFLGGYANYAGQFADWRGNLGEGGYDGSEEDWLSFTADAPVEVQLDVLFIDAEADIDIRLYHESDLSTSVASSGSTSDNESISYSIPAPGTYYLRIFIWTSATDRGPADYTVNGSINQLPVVSLAASPLSGNTPFSVDYDASGSFDPDGTITKYEWDVDGNGSYEFDTDTTPFLTADMEASGLVDSKVRITDDQGGQAVGTVQINSINAPPTVVLTADPLSGSAPLLVSFDASGSSDPDGHNLTLFEWDFDGNGTYDDSGPDPTIDHTYFSQGSFQATVRVSDEYGANATGFVTIDVSLTYSETEDNDDYSTGNILPSVDFSGWFGNLGPGGVLDGDEDDWYKLVVPGAGTYEINMYFTDALSDLDMKLFDTDGTTQLDSSTSVTDNESIEYTFSGAGTYYVECYVYSNSNPKEPQDYMLEVLPVI